MKYHHAMWTALALNLVWAGQLEASVDWGAKDVRGVSPTAESAKQLENHSRVVIIVDSGKLIDSPPHFGHVGIAVDGRYYDFGTGESKRKMPGQRWIPEDDAEAGTDFATLEAVMREIRAGEVAPESAVYTISFGVSRQQGQAIERFWRKFYSQSGWYPRYFLFGPNCVTTCMASLRAAGVTRGRLMSPRSLLHFAERRLRHTSGPKAGQPADIVAIGKFATVSPPAEEVN